MDKESLSLKVHQNKKTKQMCMFLPKKKLGKKIPKKVKINKKDIIWE